MSATKPRGPEDRVLDPDEAAELLGVSRRWLIKEGVYKRKVPFIRPPGSNQIRFLESDLWDVLRAWRHGYEIGTRPQKTKTKKGRRR